MQNLSSSWAARRARRKWRSAAAKTAAVLAEALESRRLLTATVDYIPAVGQPIRYEVPNIKGSVPTADFTPAPQWLVDHLSKADGYDIFFRLDQVTGESVDQDHQGWLEVHSFNFLGDRTPQTSTPSEDLYHDIHLAGPLSKATPILMDRLEDGRPVLDGDIAFRRHGDDFDFLQIDLDGVIVTSHRLTTVGPSAQGLPTEEFTLSYSVLRAVYTPGSGDNPGKPVQHELDLRKLGSPIFTPPAQRSLIQSGEELELAPGFDLLVRLDNIAGEVEAGPYSQSIRGSGFEWGLSRPPGTTGRTQAFELRIAGEIDASAPDLIETAAKGANILNGDLVLRREIGVVGQSFEALHMDLSNVRITSHVSSTLPDGKIRQEFTLAFSQVRVDYKSSPTASPVSYQTDAKVPPLMESFMPAQRPLIDARDDSAAVPGAGPGRDMYLNLPGIVGDVDVPGYLGAIRVLDYEWMHQGPADGAPPRFGEMRFLADTTKASPLLLEAMRNGQSSDAKFSFMQPALGGPPVERQRITLDNAVITSYQTAARGDRETPYEEFTLRFVGIDYRYFVRNPDGTLVRTATFLESLLKGGGTIPHAAPEQRALLDNNPTPSQQFFLRLDGVRGEVADVDFRDWIAVDGFSWTVDKPGLSPAFGSFHFTSRVSRATPVLFDHLIDAIASQTAELVVRAPPDDPNRKVAIAYELRNVLLNSWRLVTDDNGDVREEFTVSYNDVSMTYTPPGAAAPSKVSFVKLGGAEPFVPTQPSILMKEEEEEKEPPPKNIDAWLDLGDIEGESGDDKHKDEIDVESFSWGATRSGLNPAVFEVRAAGRADKSAPRLMQYLTDARATSDAVISVRQKGNTAFDFLNLSLRDARLTSYVVHGTDRLEQELGVSFSSAELRYTPKVLGAPGVPVVATYMATKDGPAPAELHPPQRGLLLPAVQSARRAPPMPMFLRLDGIPGEAPADGRDQEIPILGYEWLQDQVGGLTSSRMIVSEFHFVAGLSSATPLLLQHLRQNKNIASATLTIGRPDAQGGVRDFYVLNLGGARVTSHRTATFAGFGAPLEEFTLTLGTDMTPPVVTSIRFDNARRQQIVTAFSENVSQGLTASDAQVKNLDTGLLLPAGDIARTYDLSTNTATWTFPNHPGGLPDANWSFTLLAAGVSDAAGNNLPADSSVGFFSLAGDADGNRTVGFGDLVALAQNYGGSGKTFAQGNLNYDPAGNVDFADLVLLAQRYNTTLAAPPPRPAAVTGSQVLAPVQATAPARRQPRPANPKPAETSAKASLFNSVRPIPPPPAKSRKPAR